MRDAIKAWTEIADRTLSGRHPAFAAKAGPGWDDSPTTIGRKRIALFISIKT